MKFSSFEHSGFTKRYCSEDDLEYMKRKQLARQGKHRMLLHWRDWMEQKMAGLDATIEKLEEQIDRDKKKDSEES